MKLLGNYLKSHTFLSLLAGSRPFTELHSEHLFLIRIQPPIYSQSYLSLFGCSLVRVFYLLDALFTFHLIAWPPPRPWCTAQPCHWFWCTSHTNGFASDLSILISSFLTPNWLFALVGRGFWWSAAVRHGIPPHKLIAPETPFSSASLGGAGSGGAEGSPAQTSVLPAVQEVLDRWPFLFYPLCCKSCS